MPRMPMIEAAAKTLLPLALLLAATMSSARSMPIDEVIETDETTTRPTTTEEYSTFSAILDMSTESDSGDAYEIMATEEDRETFTSLPDLGLTTSGKPLESVVQGEQAEDEDAKQRELPMTMTTTENPNLPESLVDTTTTASPAISTTMLPATETTMLPGERSPDSIPNLKESRMEEIIMESQAEETTLTADVSEPIQTSQTPLKQEPSPTNGPVPLDVTVSITEPNLLQQTTNPLVEMAESTTEADAISPITTQQPESEVTEEDKSGTTETTILQMPAVTEMANMEPVTELTTPEVPSVQPELTTIVSTQETATTIAEGETTIEPPKAVVSLADAVETPASTKADESTTVSANSTNIISTTEPIVVPTTEQRPQATRAPRIERIFNADGVEVLYGYSNVLRTNRV